MEKVDLVNKSHKTSHNNKKSIQSSKSTEKTNSSEDDSVTFSSDAISLSKAKDVKKPPEIRTDLVEKYKKDISKGAYEVKTDEIVEKMILKLKEETYYKRLS